MSFAGFISRSEWGARKPRSFSSNITPRGVGIHYGGPAQNITSHQRCYEVARGWQRYHMDTNGWVDLAYSALACTHGYVFAGRGAKVRTAANGTNFGNQNYYAICGLLGQGEAPTEDMLDAFGWGVRSFRKAGAGNEVRPHSFFKATACPGDPLRGAIPTIERRASQSTTTEEPDMPLTDEDVQKVARAVWHFGVPSARSVDPEDRKWAENYLRVAARDSSAIRSALSQDALVSAVRTALGDRGPELSDQDILRIVDATIEEIAS